MQSVTVEPELTLSVDDNEPKHTHTRMPNNKLISDYAQTVTNCDTLGRLYPEYSRLHR